MGKGVHGWGVCPRSERSLSIDSKMAWQSRGMGSRPFGIEVYLFICPKTKEVNKCALKNTHSSKERKWFAAACFSMVFAHNFSGLIARSWSTEAQGNIPAFLFLRHRKRREHGCLCRRRRGFWAGRSPFSPIGRRFRIP